MNHLAHLLWPKETLAQAIVVGIVVLLIWAAVQLRRAFDGLGAAKKELQAVHLRLMGGSSTLQDALTGMDLAAHSSLARRVRLMASATNREATNAELADLDRRQFDAAVRGARFVSGICIFVGLLGTILGLALAINTLNITSPNETQITASMLRGLQQQLSDTLSGMSTAFSCTFWGVLATVVVGVFVHSYQSGVDELLLAYDGLIVADARPTAADTAGALQAAGQAVDDAAQRFVQAISPFLQTVDSSTAALSGAARELRDSIPSLEQFRGTLDVVARTFGADLPEIARAEIDARRQVQQLVLELKGTAEGLAASVPEIRTAGGQVATGLRLLNDQFGAIQQTLARQSEDHRASAAAQSAKLETAVGVLRQGVESIGAVVSDHPAVQKISSFAGKLDELTGRLDRSLEELDAQHERSTETLKLLGSRFESFSGVVKEALTKTVEDRSERTRDLGSLLAALQEFVGLVEGSLRDAPAAQLELRKVAAEGRTSIEAAQRATAALEQAGTALSRVSNELGSVSAGLRAQNAASRPYPSGPKTKPQRWNWRFWEREGR